MSADEQAIREVMAGWMKASAAGDLDAVLRLMTDDAVFMVPGREPFGKEAFAATSKGMQGMKIEGESRPVEIKVLGDWAFARTHIDMRITPPGGEPRARSGYTLTLFTRGADGAWRLARDANLVT